MSEILELAVKRAQHTFKIFVRELSWERRRIHKTHELAIVRLDLKTNRGGTSPKVESVWVDNFQFDGRLIHGNLIYEPRFLKNKSKDQSVLATIDQVSDWMFVSKGKVYGGFTIQGARQGMPLLEREKHDKKWNLDFGNPYEPRLSYLDYQIDDDLNQIEQPFGRKIAQNFSNYLSQSRELFQYTDRAGNTILHMEALAGNSRIVETLLNYGADSTALNKYGQTVMDMAEIFQWTKVIDILKKRKGLTSFIAV
ncbi:DUF2314 domain-containing protein [Spirochaeta cellobiosiphila]|uniref:DUF2314 domain-containing protein n=1 Tax=Spirochaeta cellobiosiphila TaxID=504483 RepID=UPI0003FA7D4F|nr:DUF2314 domain-containing protein [Spirochaeta cellobiosiphila]